MIHFNRICLCDQPQCAWCQVWHKEQSQKELGRGEAVKDILRTKFKGKND